MVLFMRRNSGVTPLSRNFSQRPQRVQEKRVRGSEAFINNSAYGTLTRLVEKISKGAGVTNVSSGSAQKQTHSDHRRRDWPRPRHGGALFAAWRSGVHLRPPGRCLATNLPRIGWRWAARDSQ